MKSPRSARSGSDQGLMWDLLTLDRLITAPVSHLVYWCGLGLIALTGFMATGAAVGTALREGSIIGWLLAIPTFAAGMLVMVILGLLWRSFCELYVVVIRIGQDLTALRKYAEGQAAEPQVPTPAPPPPAPPRPYA